MVIRTAPAARSAPGRRCSRRQPEIRYGASPTTPPGAMTKNNAAPTAALPTSRSAIRFVAHATIRRTLGISCERPICSTLVCFIPLFDGLVARRNEPYDATVTARDCCDNPMRLLTNPGWRPQGAPSPRMPQQPTGSVVACPQRADPRREAPARDLRGCFSTNHSRAGAQRNWLRPRRRPVWPTGISLLAQQLAVAPTVAHSSRRRSRDTGLGPSNTGDKLRASNTLNARLLHPLVRWPRRSACVVCQPGQALSQTRSRDDGNATPNGAHQEGAPGSVWSATSSP